MSSASIEGRARGGVLLRPAPEAAAKHKPIVAPLNPHKHHNAVIN
jgi:hypothetical protein